MAQKQARKKTQVSESSSHEVFNLKQPFSQPLNEKRELTKADCKQLGKRTFQQNKKFSKDTKKTMCERKAGFGNGAAFNVKKQGFGKANWGSDRFFDEEL